MNRIGTVFAFTVPDGWQEFRQGARHIFHGPNGEELMVSASSVQGQGTSGDLAGVQLRLFQNAEKTVKNAAADPELQITRPFHKHLVPSALEPWSLHAQTHEGDTLFYQAVCCDPRGVLLVTLEAPNTQQSQTIFERFINSIKPASAGGHVN